MYSTVCGSITVWPLSLSPSVNPLALERGGCRLMRLSRRKRKRRLSGCCGHGQRNSSSSCQEVGGWSHCSSASIYARPGSGFIFFRSYYDELLSSIVSLSLSLFGLLSLASPPPPPFWCHQEPITRPANSSLLVFVFFLLPPHFVCVCVSSGTKTHSRQTVHYHGFCHSLSFPFFGGAYEYSTW